MACGGISRALAPFYRHKEAGRWPARVAARSMAFNGSREWRLDGQEETVGRGRDRAVASWHFPTRGERRGVMTAGRTATGVGLAAAALETARSGRHLELGRGRGWSGSGYRELG
jgi:hypothetical protein